MKVNNEFKLTVANVAKITYTITLGIAIGKAAAKFVTSLGKSLIEYTVEQLEKIDISDKKKVDYDAEFDKAVGNADTKEEAEGEPES